MRFLDLRLIAYGPFTDTHLDLDAGGPALHLIYGSNEAGKSSTLRAVFGLLYGIEHATADAHVHAMNELRIGARLTDAHGRTLSVIRRKGLKHTLLDEQERPLPDAALTPFLHGIAEPMYRASFGLDHRGLRHGAEALLAGKGDLGESLFQAGLGLTGVHDVLAKLEREASELFKPRGVKQPLNDAIAEYKEAIKRSRDELFSAEAWQEERRAYEEAMGQRAGLDQRLERLRREKTRFDRIRQVATRVAERERLLAARAELGAVVPLGADASTRRRNAVQELEDARRALSRIEAEQARLTEKREGLQVSESLLSVRDETIRELRDLIGKDTAARADRLKREGEKRELERQANAVLRRLGRRTGKEQIANASLESGLAARIQSLASEQSGLAAGLDHAQQERERCRAKLLRVEQRIDGLGADAAPDPSRVPGREQVQAFEREQRELEASQGRLAERERELSQLEERNRCEWDALRGGGELPTEAQLLEVRAERDARWAELGRELTQQRPDLATARDRLGAGLDASARSDALGDRLRRETKLVEALARLAAERESVARILERVRADQAAALAAVSRWQQRWQTLWEASGQEARAPVEMLAWLGRHEQAVHARAEQQTARAEAQDAVDAAEVSVVAATRRLSAWRSAWATEVARLELGSETTVEEAHAAIEELNQLGQLQVKLETTAGRIEGMARDRQHFEREVLRLADRHLYALGDATTEERAELLVRSHEAAKAALRQRDELDRELERLARERADEAVRRDAADSTLATLLSAAAATTLPELEHAERRSDELRRISTRLAELETELLAEGAGASLDELARQTREVDPDALPHRLDALEAELTELISQKEEVAGRIMKHELAMRGHDSRQLAADAASDAALQLSAIRAHAARYVRLKLAASVLEREVARYRDAHHGPILALAEGFFGQLTLGRYTKLDVGFDARDEPELACIDVQGRSVPIPGLSDSTRDALYLALRVATLLRHGERDELMPLVLDDVLIHFDEERAQAALKVLGEVSRHMQVLFFTHNARLRELARAAVPAAQLREHELPSASARDAVLRI